MDRKRFFAILAVAVALVAVNVVPAFSQTRSAADSQWSFSFSSGYFSDNTDIREKDDYTSTYFWYEYGDINYLFMQVWGCNSSSSYSNAQNVTGWYQGSSFGGAHTVYNNTYGNRYFTNSVYELGYSNCFLRVISYYIPGIAGGWWSPDSV